MACREGEMENIANDPVFQSAIVPFSVSLFAVLGLKRLGGLWPALAVALGFYAAVYLIRGFEFFPLRSTNKILLSGLGGVALGLLLDGVRIKRYIKPILFLAAFAVVIWLIWPRFKRLDGWELYLVALGCGLYGAWLVTAFTSLRGRAIRADSAVMVLALGTGITSILGATALYGQLASAIAAAAGAKLFLNLIGKDSTSGLVMLLPATLLCALLGVGAVVYAKLPGYNLALFALIPLLAQLPLPAWPRWLEGVVVTAICLLPVSIAIYLTWRAAGGLPY